MLKHNQDCTLVYVRNRAPRLVCSACLSQLTSQHPYAHQHIGPPHVYTINMDDLAQVEEVVKEIVRREVGSLCMSVMSLSVTLHVLSPHMRTTSSSCACSVASQPVLTLRILHGRHVAANNGLPGAPGESKALTHCTQHVWNSEDVGGSANNPASHILLMRAYLFIGCIPCLYRLLPSPSSPPLPLPFPPPPLPLPLSPTCMPQDFCNPKQWPPLSELKVVVGNRGESCKETCSSRGMFPAFQPNTHIARVSHLCHAKYLDYSPL